GNMSQEWSRALLDIAVGYGSDIDAAAAAIKAAADEMAAEPTYQHLFLSEPQIWGVEELGRDVVKIRLVIKTVPGEQWAISRELRRRIKLALDSIGVETPFPQQTLWLRRDIENQGGDGERAPSAPSAATGKAAPEEGATDTSSESPGSPQSA